MKKIQLSLTEMVLIVAFFAAACHLVRETLPYWGLLCGQVARDVGLSR